MKSSILGCLVLCGGWGTQLSAQDEPTELEAFISEETALEDFDSLLPTDRTVDSAFFAGMSLMETPRSILTLSPETMEQFQIKDFADLSKIGAGTERVNFYGIAGAPMIRGWQGGTYFNGMMRAFQRNEMPTSFGSLEAINIVKGPAPAQFAPSHVGGFANMIPKSPYFDEFRGSVKLEVGSHEFFNVQVDVGEPILFMGLPSAYRVSITAQQAGSYYNRINNDFFSIYASIKTQISDDIRIFTGGEYFQFKSNENAGWNRPTQNLIDNGEYVIGEPLSLVSSENGGVAERNAIDGLVWDYGTVAAENRALFRALVVPQAIVDDAVASGAITADQRALMANMADEATRNAAYAGIPDSIARTTSGYVYTPEYFLAGGDVFTTQIEGSDVLSDDADFADSLDFIYFFDIVGTPSETLEWKHQFFFEYLETRKLSSYGYAFDSDQLVLDNRFTITQDFALADGVDLKLSYGLQFRYNEALQLQDFWVEPFARRDISTGVITSNSVILSGPQRDPIIGGGNYWAGGFGAAAPAGHAVKSELTQAAIFTVGDLSFMDGRLSVLFGLRGEAASWEAEIPSQAPDASFAGLNPDGSNPFSDEIDFFNFSINPNFRVTENVSLYGAYQEATTFAPTQGGAVIGEGNFGDAELVEGGVKVTALDGRFFASLAYYEWEQSSFNDRAAVSDQYESEGLELELTYQITDEITLIASYNNRETRKVNNLGFRTMPWGLIDPTGAGNDEIGVALGSGSLLNQFAAAFGGFTPEGGDPSDNPNRDVPGAPETSIKLFGVYKHESGFGASAGVVLNDEYYHNYDHTLEIPDTTVVSGSLFYTAESWELRLSVENLTDEDFFVGADPEFAANTLITKGEERSYNVSFTYNF